MKTGRKIHGKPSGGMYLALKFVVLNCLLGFAIVGLTESASAAVYREWRGTASVNWSNPNNWDPIGLPQPNETLRFYGSGASLINDIPNLIVNSLLFGENDWVLSGNPVTIGGPGPSGIGQFGSGVIQVSGTRTDASSFTTINCALILNTNDCRLHCQAFDGSYGRLRINADINLNGFNLIINASSKSIANLDDGIGRIELAGSISGIGDVTAMASGYPDGTIEFLGTANNSFAGTLFIRPNVPSSANGVYFNKQVGYVANSRVVIEKAARVYWRNSNQIGDNATVVVNDGSLMDLDGYNETIGTLVLTNVSADASPSVVDTVNSFLDVTGTLTVNDGIISWVNNASVLPTITGILNLPAGERSFFISGQNYAGLDLRAEIKGLGGFAKYGNAALLLKGTNTFGGTVNVLQGVVDVSHPNGFGSPAGGVVLNGGSVTLRTVSITNETLFSRGTGQITPETAGSLLTSIGSSGWVGAIELDTNLVVVGDMLLTGPISGAGGLGCFGGGTIRLGGTLANTYTGTTLVRCPLLEFNKPNNVKAFSGPLIVGGSGPAEARWLASSQAVVPNLTVFANATVNLNHFNQDFGPITFSGGTISSGVGLVGINGLVTVNASSAIASFLGKINLPSGYREFRVADGSGPIDLQVSASVGGPGHLQKTGAGQMWLNASNSYTGLTLVDEGTLVANNAFALGATTSGTLVSDGATVSFNSINNTLGEVISLRGAGVGGTNGALNILGNATLRSPFPSISACLDLTTNAFIRVESGGRLIADGFISGVGPLTKIGPGALVFTNSNPNIYSQDTIVREGTLELRKPSNTISVPGNLVIGPATAGSPATTRWFQTGGINANSNFTVNANSNLDLNGNNQNLVRLTLNDGGDVQTGVGNLNFLSGGLLTVGSLNGSGSQASSSFSGRLGLPPNEQLVFAVAAYAPGPPVGAPELDVSAQISAPVENVNFERAGIWKNGSGEMRLSGNNTFNGRVDVSAGTLTVGSGTALGSTFDGTFVANSASLALINGIAVNNETLFLNSTHSAALDNRGGNNSWSGPITLARASNIGASQDWSLTASGVIGGAGSLTKVGTGVLWLSGTANNTYAGDTFVNEGWLGLGKSPFIQAVPANLIIGRSGGGTSASVLHVSTDQIWANVTVNNGGGLNLNGYNENIASLTLNGGGDVFTGAGTLNLTSVLVNPGGFADQSVISGRLGLNASTVPFMVAAGSPGGGIADCLVSAIISQTSATAGLQKSGNGVLQLTGTNTYAGLTSLSAGTLRVDGSQAQSAMQVSGGKLLGLGTIGNVNFLGSSGIIAPGASPGILTCSNFHAGATGAGILQMELNGVNPSQFDQIDARGSVTLTGITLNGSLNFPSAINDQFVIINQSKAGAVIGTFTGLPQNASFYIGTEKFTISYSGGTGNDVVLTRIATPVPPALEIYRVSTNAVRLYWFTSETNFNLHYTTNLANPNWLPTAPPTVVNKNYNLTNTIIGAERYYRLIAQ